MAVGEKKEAPNITVQRIVEIVLVAEYGSVLKFANRVGIATSNYHMWVGRNRPPKLETLIKISKAYGVSIEWLKGADIEESICIPYDAKPDTPPPRPLAPSDLSRILALWERDKDEAKADKERLFAMVAEQQRIIEAQAAAVKSFADKVDDLTAPTSAPTIKSGRQRCA